MEKIKLIYRVIGIVLCFLTIANIAACANNDSKEPSDTNSDTTTAVEETTEIIKPNLPDTKFDGKEFLIMGREDPAYPQFTNFEFWVEIADGDVVNDAVFNRNATIEDRYDVVIKQELVKETISQLKKLVSSVEDRYDVAALNDLTGASTIAASNHMLDFNKIDYIDFTKPWWNADVNSELSFAGKLYYTTSDYLLLDKQRTYILIFNKKLADSYNLGNLFQLVRDNKWTSDTMLNMLVTVSSDLDGGGKMTDEDQYGLGMDSYLSFYTFYTGMGGRIAGRDENDNPTLVMNSEKNVSIIEKLMNLTCNQDIAFFCNDYSGKVKYDFWYTSSNMFYAGRILFITAFPHMLKSISANTDVDFEYGVIPNPKYDENQDKYYTIPDSYHSMVLTIPVTNNDESFAGFMLEALSAESMTTTLPAYYEISCQTKYIYDKESAEMLDIIFNGIIYDLGSIFDWGTLGAMLKSTIPAAKKNNFASQYAKLETKAMRDIEKTIEKFENAE